MKPKNLKIALVGAAFFLLFGWVVAQGIQRTWVYYYTVDELMDNAGKVNGRVVKTSGTVVPGSIQQQGLSLDFLIEENGETLRVRYRGAIPDAFTDEVPVVAEGVYHRSGNVLEARTLMTKCPSRYEAEGDADQQAADS